MSDANVAFLIAASTLVLIVLGVSFAAAWAARGPREQSKEWKEWAPIPDPVWTSTRGPKTTEDSDD